MPPRKSTPAASASADMPSTRLSMSISHGEVVGLRRREREAAVAGEERGDAVPRRGRRGRIPVELRVVVRVDVDEAGRDREPVGVDTSRARRRRCDRRDDRARRARRRRRCAAGAPVPSTTVPPRISRSSGSVHARRDASIPYMVERVAAEQARRARPASIASVCSRSSSTTPGYFASLCGKSEAQTNRSPPTSSASERRGALAGIEADPALALEVLARRERQVRRRPAVALEELVEPVHPVRDPAAAALEHGHLERRDGARARRRTRGSTASSSGRTRGSARGACPAP